MGNSCHRQATAAAPALAVLALAPGQYRLLFGLAAIPAVLSVLVLAALGFMDWQVRRGLLNAPDGEVPGSPWWRAVNERLLRDTAEARAHLLGLSGPMSSWSASCCVEFAQSPSARTWYRAHNASIVAAYLDHRELAESETHPERFFLNLILVRVLFAHALVAAPRLALSWLWPVGPVLGDP